jgi:UbiD family decarboxylase
MMTIDTQAGKLDDTRTEAMADLREFLRQVDAGGELQRVDGATIDHEVGVLFDLANMYRHPPVLLSENIPGYDPRFRIISNVRTAKLIVGELTLDAVKAYRKRPKNTSVPILPEMVEHGPVCENIIEGDAIDIRAFPAPHWHPNDGGRYIGTECLVIMKDPDSDWVNVGTYRTSVIDGKTLSVFIDTGKQGDFIRRKYWERGEACPVAVSVGQAPILGVVGAMQANVGDSEFAIAGGRIGRPIKLVTGKATGLPIPADAELVFEGFMPPPSEETQLEGPFGEWPGYYASEARLEPVVRVSVVYHRSDLMIVGQAPLTPIHPGQQFKIQRIAALWDQIEAAGVPGVTGVYKMLGGGSRFIELVSIKQMFPGHAKMAGMVTASCRASGYMTRMVIVVDDDIDIEVPAQVMWALATRWDPKTQTDIIDGCWTGHIDPILSPDKRASGDLTTSRMIVYAVRPYHWKDQFPKANTLSKEYIADVVRNWRDKLPFVRDLEKANGFM